MRKRKKRSCVADTVGLSAARGSERNVIINARP
jgi:hypothetical protein